MRRPRRTGASLPVQVRTQTVSARYQGRLPAASLLPVSWPARQTGQFAAQAGARSASRPPRTARARRLRHRLGKTGRLCTAPLGRACPAEPLCEAAFSLKGGGLCSNLTVQQCLGHSDLPSYNGAQPALSGAAPPGPTAPARAAEENPHNPGAVPPSWRGHIRRLQFHLLRRAARHGAFGDVMHPCLRHAGTPRTGFFLPTFSWLYL